MNIGFRPSESLPSIITKEFVMSKESDQDKVKRVAEAKAEISKAKEMYSTDPWMLKNVLGSIASQYNDVARDIQNSIESASASADKEITRQVAQGLYNSGDSAASKDEKAKQAEEAKVLREELKTFSTEIQFLNKGIKALENEISDDVKRAEKRLKALEKCFKKLELGHTLTHKEREAAGLHMSDKEREEERKRHQDRDKALKVHVDKYAVVEEKLSQHKKTRDHPDTPTHIKVELEKQIPHLEKEVKELKANVVGVKAKREQSASIAAKKDALFAKIIVIEKSQQQSSAKQTAAKTEMPVGPVKQNTNAPESQTATNQGPKAKTKDMINRFKSKATTTPPKPPQGQSSGIGPSVV